MDRVQKIFQIVYWNVSSGEPNKVIARVFEGAAFLMSGSINGVHAMVK
jgi:hypothetical protein